MDFIDALRVEAAKSTFAKGHVSLCTKPRSHTSLSMIAGDMREVKANDALLMKFSDDTPRYALARDLIYDMLVSIYDVNTTKALVIRLIAEMDDSDIKKIGRMVGMWKRPNIEVRAIGMQNGHGELFLMIEKLCGTVKGKLVEAELFGNLIRHVAIDMKTGMSYDVLLIDRIYRPGELVNQNAAYTYTPGTSKLNFA